jgi:antagonist of KipI
MRCPDRGALRRARAYLAFGGGIAVGPVLGSRSSDVNSALGPQGGRALQAGDALPLGRAGTATTATLRALARAGGDANVFAATHWSIDPAPWFEAGDDAWIALVRGAHFERLDAASRRALFDEPFRVGADSNRVGYRLEGPALSFSEPLELISEGVAPGTVQLPPGGQTLVLMAEAPTTGGYPRIAHVAGVDLPRLAQCRPGGRVRFFETSLADAQTRYLERERALAALIRSIRDRLRA